MLVGYRSSSELMASVTGCLGFCSKGNSSIFKKENLRRED
jgi:hypothetical protein